MGRVINTNNPGKRRNAAMRTIAEILRRLGQHQGSINDDVLDMVAMMVYCLREIDDTVIESIQAWEKRGYWQKADKFQVEWMWAEQMASRIERLIKSENWQDLPEVMVKLFPHFSDIEIKSMTRNEKEWQGAFERLKAQLQ